MTSEQRCRVLLLGPVVPVTRRSWDQDQAGISRRAGICGVKSAGSTVGFPGHGGPVVATDILISPTALDGQALPPLAAKGDKIIMPLQFVATRTLFDSSEAVFLRHGQLELSSPPLGTRSERARGVGSHFRNARIAWIQH